MKTLRRFALIALTLVTASVSAQEVATLFFLENAPMRHMLNPAFQPVSDGYVLVSPWGYTSLWLGNNSLTASDLIFNQNGQTVTALHPDVSRSTVLKPIRKVTLNDMSLTMNLASFGFRYKEKGYIHIGISERVEVGLSVPRTLAEFVLDGGMSNPDGINSYDITRLGSRMSAYMEIAGGYSHQLNEKWTIGGKLKFLLGHAYIGFHNNDLKIKTSTESWHIQGTGNVVIAAPINKSVLPNELTYDNTKGINVGDLLKGLAAADYIEPQGYGAALDFGFTYKPHKQVQISAALNDLGFIVWNKGYSYKTSDDSIYTGIPGMQYDRYKDANNKFDIQKLLDDVVDALENYARSIHSQTHTTRFTRMLSARLNVGVDANFCHNILGVGILSKTRLFNNRLYEEVTIGGAVRPVNWFNFALSYSLINNGKYSNFGAGISIMPYDGINMTLAMDYIPTTYAYTGKAPIPYKTSGVNLALGFSIVWGTNHKPDQDKDGVWDKIDMCPNTPRNVKVDLLGCPADTDGDGVPDYLDQCPETSEKAYGLIDTLGCPLDTDSDGVADYLDRCPNTLPEARAFVDSCGCDLDTDKDGVPDYRDSCPNTLPEAVNFVDALGCDKDTDGDGVPDYRDKCPETKPEAIAFVDSLGCDRDDDGDGVPNYIDKCPEQPGPAYNSGCPEVKKEVRNLLKKAMQGIQFETGKAIIKSSSNPIMNEIAAQFIANPNYVIEVQGHTDNVGKPERNKELSQQRAEAVREYLIGAGVPAERLTAVGYGDEMPIADNKTKKGRAENRRVAFDITIEQITYETIYDHADSTLLRQHLEEIKAMQMPQEEQK